MRERCEREIRIATVHDAERLALIDIESDHPKLKEKGYTDLESARRHISDRFHSNREEFFILESGDNPLGYCTLQTDTPISCELYWLSVRKAFHRTGVGRQLVLFLESYARERQFKYMLAFTSPDNERSHEFNIRMGFERLVDVSNFYGYRGNKAAVLYLKHL